MEEDFRKYGKPDYRNWITFKAKEANGVLFVSREPGDASSGQNISGEDEKQAKSRLKGNYLWYCKLWEPEAKLKRGEKRVKCHLLEILEEVIKNTEDRELKKCSAAEELKKCSYTNITFESGGNKLSENYKNMKPCEKRKRVQEIIDSFGEVKCKKVFLVKDIFEAYFDQEINQEINQEKLKGLSEIPGIIYQKGKREEKTLKAYKNNDNDTEFYAMYHPSQWAYKFKGIGENRV